MSEVNKPASDPSDIASKNAMLENEQLKLEAHRLKTENDTLRKALVKANDTIEQQNKAQMAPNIKANTTLTDAEIYAMASATMKDLCDNFRLLKKPVASIAPGQDEADMSPMLTVPNKFKYGPKGGNK